MFVPCKQPVSADRRMPAVCMVWLIIRLRRPDVTFPYEARFGKNGEIGKLFVRRHVRRQGGLLHGLELVSWGLEQFR